jgi:hypothetical protein
MLLYGAMRLVLAGGGGLLQMVEYIREAGEVTCRVRRPSSASSGQCQFEYHT